MSYVFSGITIETARPDISPAAGTAAGAVGALSMATTWCAIAHFTQGDASLPIRAIAATVLGKPSDDDPRRTAIAIALGLLIHFAIGMGLGHGLDRAARELPWVREHARGARLVMATAIGIALLACGLDKLAPAFVLAIPSAAFVVSHLLFGIALELTGLLRKSRRARVTA